MGPEKWFSMAMSYAERGSLGGRTRSEKLTPQQRSEVARLGAQAHQNPVNQARKIGIAWPTMDQETRDQIRALLLPVLAEGR